MARLVVATAAAAVAAYFSGGTAALQTFALVYGATGFLDPRTKVLGPKLNDLKAPAASYGAVIPYVEGGPRLAGCVVWSSDKRAVSHTESQGKGGPGVDSTTYTYEMDMLVALACNPCDAVRRIFSNGKLVWSQAEDATAETLAASAATTSWRSIRFYKGDPDQLPDPLYEAAVGVGNAPAYRGRATVMLEGLNLGGSGQIPILTFELARTATPTAVQSIFMDAQPIGGIGRGSSTFSLAGFRLHLGQWDNGYANSVVNVYDVSPTGEQRFLFTYDNVSNQPAGTSHQTDSDGLLSYGGGDLFARDFFWTEAANAGLGDAPNFYGFRVPADQVHGYGGLNVSIRGDDLIQCSGQSFGSRKVNRFVKGAGGSIVEGARAEAVATSPDLGVFITSVVNDGTRVYAIATNSRVLKVLDRTTLALQDTVPFPPSDLTTTTSMLTCDPVTNRVYLTTNRPNTWRLDGGPGAWTWSIFMPGVGCVVTQNDVSAGMENGVIRFAHLYAPGNGTSYRVTQNAATIAAATEPLDQVVRRLCLRTKQLTDDDIDVSLLAGRDLRAMAVSQVSTSRTVLEQLMQAYQFGAAESAKLRFVPRGAATVVTIPFDDLGVSPEGDADPLPKKRINDMEVAARISIRYANVDNDFQDGLEAADRLITSSTGESVIEVPLGLKPVEARQLADVLTLDAAVSLNQIGPFQVSRKYAALEPTDPVVVTARDGSTFRVRLLRMKLGGGIIEAEPVLDDASVVNSAATTDTDYSSSALIRTIVDTVAMLLDIPLLRDEDNKPGFYVTAKGARADGLWPGYTLNRSSDDTNYTEVLRDNRKGVFGTATTVLADFPGGFVFDESSRVTVDLDGGVLSSATRETLLADRKLNVLLLGDEVVQFRTAALLSPGVYTLSGFLRGLRGTEWAMPTHQVDERAVLLSETTLGRINDTAADRGIVFSWKAATLNTSLVDAKAMSFADTGVALKPFAPVDIRVEPTGYQDMRVTWKRRSRLTTSFVGSSGSVVPLGETLEAYEVDVYVGATKKRTIGGLTTPACTYTRGMQAADGVVGPTVVTFKVFQLSSAVGRGYPGTGSAPSLRVSAGQVSTVTFGGVFESGRTVVLNFMGLVNPSTGVPSTTTVHAVTAAATTDLATSATNLRNAINGDSLLTSSGITATSSGAVVTVSGPLGYPFVISYAGVQGEQVFGSDMLQEASPARAGTTRKINAYFSSTDVGGFRTKSGYTYVVRFSREGNPYRVVQYSFTADSPSKVGLTYAQLAIAMAQSTPTSSPSGTPAGIFWNPAYGADQPPRAEFPLNELDWTVTGYSSDPAATLGAAVVDIGALSYVAPVPQVVRFLLQGVYGTVPWASGSKVRFTLGGVNFDYTVPGGSPDWPTIIGGLKTLIEASGNYTVQDLTNDYYVFLGVTSTTPNLPFTYSGRFGYSTMTFTVATTQEAN